MGQTTVVTTAPPTSAPDVDPRPRWRRMVGPVSTIGGLAAATLFIAVVDPNQPGHYPVCPTKALFGLDCPGCGGLRATHDLAHGDVVSAFGHNALWVLLVPIAVVMLGRYAYQGWTGRRQQPMAATAARRSMIALVVLMVIFTVVRNLPFGAFFGSG